MQKTQKIKAVISYSVFLLLATVTVFHLALAPAMGDISTLGAANPSAGTAVIIDAGHGGEDGGAVSPSGNVESHVNLAIAQRLDTLLGLFGQRVIMLRTEDVSLHDGDAETLRQKKVSDLHNRVASIEAIHGATLISIHQNTYAGGAKYHGAQVFYANPEQSLPFAQHTQEALRLALDTDNGRHATKIPDTVYLMNHISCRAILVECGFLTNPAEDALLQTDGYRTKIAVALAAAYLGYEEPTTEEEPQYEG